MTWHHLWGWSVLLLISSAAGFAQDDSKSSSAPTSPVLPEVVVEAQPPTSAEYAESGDRTTSPWDRPLSYPNLQEQSFGGLNSTLRGDQSLFDVPQHATIIDRRQLEEKTAQDMFQTLEQEVGVMVQRTARGQSAPFIRGLTGQDVLILIDGVRLNNSTFRSGPNQYFNTIDPGQVQRIEIVRGPGSVLYGSDAIGGVINVVTRDPDRMRGNYGGWSMNEYASTADAGTYTRMDGEGWRGAGGVFGGASYFNVNDVQTAGPLGRQPFTHYDQYAGDVKYQRLLSNDALLTIALQHFEQQGLPRSDRFPPFIPESRSRPTFFDTQQRDLAYLRIQGTGDRWISAYSFTASYARQKEGTRIFSNYATFIDPSQPGTHDDGQFDVGTAGLALAAASDLDRAGKLTYGFDWYHDHVDAWKYRYDNPTDTLVGPRTPQFPNDSFYEQFGVYLSWDVPLTGRLDAQAGVRYSDVHLASTPIIDINGVPTPVHITPNYQDWVGDMGLTYALTDYLKLCGSIAEGFRAPNLDDLVATNPLVQQEWEDLPSIDLRPENSINYEVGLKLDAPRLRTEVFVYWMDLRNAILRTPVAQGLFQRSNRRAYLNGAEWNGEYLVQGGWSVYGNVAYTFGQDTVLDQPLSRIPPTQGVLGLRWRSKDSRSWLDFYAWLVDRQERLNFQDLTDARIPPGGTPGFQTLNLRAGKTFGRRLNHQVSVSLENLNNQAYRVHGSGVDGPGINAIFGYSFRQ